jgi:MFS family permease
MQNILMTLKSQANTMDKKNLFILLAALSIFMELFDSTVLLTSLTHISKFFKVNVFELKAVIVNYFIGLSIFIPVCSYLVSKYTERNVFIVACLIFISASLVCGLSTNLTELEIFRFIQGVGASLMTPTTIMMAYRVFSTQDVVRISSLINIPALVGAGLGPFIGGIISQNFYWGWIFFINVPIGLGLILLCLVANKISPLPPHIKENIKFDKIGFLLLATALVTAAILIEKLDNQLISSPVYCTILVIFFISILLYIFHQKKMGERSLLELSLFKVNSFFRGISINIFSRIAISGVAFILPIFLQHAIGLSVKMSGFIIMFVAVGAIVSKFFLTRLITVYGFQKSLSISAIALAFSISLFCFIRVSESILLIIMFCLFYGLISSFQYTAMNSLVLKDIIQKDVRKAVNINAIFQQFSNGLGVAVAAFIASSLLKNQHISLILGYRITFILLAVIGILTVVIVNVKPPVNHVAKNVSNDK